MFDAVRETEKIITFIRDYYEKNHLKGAVLGISGGKDSGVVAGLMCKALGSENVVGITLPCHSKEADAADAKLVAEKFGFELLNIDLTDVYDSFKVQVGKLGEFTDEETKNSDINIKPRFRMASVYYMAALLSATRGGTYIVPGTSNACELYVGYFTKGVPEKVLYRTPDDGISGLSDEDKLGVRYSDIAKVINGEEVGEEAEKKIEELHRKAAHKFHTPVYRK